MSSELSVSKRKPTSERSSARHGAGSPRHVASKRHPKGLSSGKDTPSVRNSPDQRCSPQPPQRSLRVSPGAASMTTPRQRPSMNKLREVSPVPQARKTKNSQTSSGIEDTRKHRSRSNDCSPPKSSQKACSVESPHRSPPRRAGSPQNHPSRELASGIPKESSPKRAPIRTRVPPKSNPGIKQHLRKQCESPISSRSPMLVEGEEDDYERLENGPSWRFRSPANQERKHKIRQESSSAACTSDEIRRILYECEKLKVEAEETLKNGVEQIQLNVALKDKFSVASETACELMEKMADVSGSANLRRLANEAKNAQQRKAEQAHFDPLNLISEEGVDKCFISKPTPRVRSLGLSSRHRESMAASEKNREVESTNFVSKFDSSRSAQEEARVLMPTSGLGSPGQKASLASPVSPNGSHGVSPIASSCMSFSTISSLGSARSMTSTTASCSDVPGKLHRLDASSQIPFLPKAEGERWAVQPSPRVFQPSPRVVQSPRLLQARETLKSSKIANVDLERPLPDDTSTRRRSLSLQAPSYAQYAFQQVAPQPIEIAESPRPTNGTCSPAAIHGSPSAHSKQIINCGGSFVVPRTAMGSSSVSVPLTMNASLVRSPQITNRSCSISLPQTDRPGSVSVPSKPSLSGTWCAASQGVGRWADILQQRHYAPGLVVAELQIESLEASCPSLKRALVGTLGLLEDVTIHRMSTHGGLNMGIYTAQDASNTLILKFATSTRYMGLPTEAELLLSLSKQIPAILSDRDVAFPIGIFLLTACSQTRNLIVMNKVRGQALADIISEKLHSGQRNDIKGLLHEFGRFLSRFHKRYGMQHCDCQAGNVFYDESSGRFSLIDLSDMGSPLVKTLDVDYFCTALQGLMRKHSQHLYDECSLAFKTGYSA